MSSWGDEVAGWLAGRGPRAARLALLLTGDPVTARRALESAVSGAVADRAQAREEGLDAAVFRRLATGATRVAPHADAALPEAKDERQRRNDQTWRRWQALSPQHRAALAFRHAEEMTESEIGWLLRRRPEAVAADGAGAVATLGGDEAVRGLLDDPRLDELATTPGWDDVLDRRRRDRRHRLRLVAAVVVMAAALIGCGLGVAAGVRALQAPRAPHVAGLLPWVPRGGLVRDHRFVTAAERVWRTKHASLPGPGRHTYVLYAGRVGVGRLAVLQSVGARGPLLAVVAEHDHGFGNPQLDLDTVQPLAGARPPALVVGYDGNLGLAELNPGPASQVVQVLVGPGVESVSRRSPGSPEPLARDGFVGERLDAGLSQPWLDFSGGGRPTVLRLRGPGSRVWQGRVPPLGQLLPLPG